MARDRNKSLIRDLEGDNRRLEKRVKQLEREVSRLQKLLSRVDNIIDVVDGDKNADECVVPDKGDVQCKSCGGSEFKTLELVDFSGNPKIIKTCTECGKKQ